MSEKKERIKRLSKKQVESGLLADLIAIVNDISDDGKLEDTELERLNDWLATNEIEEFPSVVKLQEEVSALVGSAIIDGEGLRNIHKLIERIVPKECSELIASKRKHRIQEDKTKREQSREREKEERRKERDQNSSINSYNFMVAGYHIPENQETIAEEVSDAAIFSLAREADNPHDRNAILVRANRFKIGYVPRSLAEEMAEELDSGCSYRIRLSKVIGYKNIVPVIDVSIHSPEATLSDCKFPEIHSYLDEKRFEAKTLGCVLLAIFIPIAIIVSLVL